MPPKPPKKPEPSKLPNSPGQSNSRLRIGVIPIVRRFFFISKSDIHPIGTQTIPANQFIDDNGISIISFPNLTRNRYINLFINGVMQQGGLYSITTNNLILNPTGDTIPSGTPIILEIVQFSVQLIP